MNFEESKACVELIGNVYGFDVTVNKNDDFYLDCTWLGMPDMADDSGIVIAARGKAEDGVWLRLPEDLKYSFYKKTCKDLSNADLYMCHYNKTTGKKIYIRYASVPEFSSFDELQIKLACISRVLDDAPWRALFHKFCSKYKLRCQFCDYGNWNYDPVKNNEFWFLSEFVPESGAGVRIGEIDDFYGSHNTRLPLNSRMNRIYDAAAVMKNIAGKRMSIEGKRYSDTTTIVLPAMDRDTTAEEYEIRLAVNGLI